MPTVVYIHHPEGWHRSDLRPLAHKCLRRFVLDNPAWFVRPIDNSNWLDYIHAPSAALTADPEGAGD